DRDATWYRADAQGYCRQRRSRRPPSSDQDDGPRNRGRYVKIRLLFCAPSLSLSNSSRYIHRFREGIISLLFALRGGLLGLGFRLGLSLALRRGRSLRLAVRASSLRRIGLRLGLGLALGPRRRFLRRLGAAGEDLGDADHREFVPRTALAARILAPALLEGDHLVAAGVLEHLAGNGGARNGRRTDLRAIAA